MHTHPLVRLELLYFHGDGGGLGGATWPLLRIGRHRGIPRRPILKSLFLLNWEVVQLPKMLVFLLLF